MVQRGGNGRGRSPPRPLLAVPNVTIHPSTASVPITVLLYSGPLLCGFNVPIKRLSSVLHVINCFVIFSRVVIVVFELKAISVKLYVQGDPKREASLLTAHIC